jgi:hypothetical protein
MRRRTLSQLLRGMRSTFDLSGSLAMQQPLVEVPISPSGKQLNDARELLERVLIECLDKLNLDLTADQTWLPREEPMRDLSTTAPAEPSPPRAPSDTLKSENLLDYEVEQVRETIRNLQGWLYRTIPDDADLNRRERWMTAVRKALGAHTHHLVIIKLAENVTLVVERESFELVIDATTRVAAVGPAAFKYGVAQYIQSNADDLVALHV